MASTGQFRWQHHRLPVTLKSSNPRRCLTLKQELTCIGATANEDGKLEIIDPPSPKLEMDQKLRQNKPRLLLMGQRRSGKSSITSVVFHKMPPQETLFLESTTRIQKDSMQ